jgi:predicted amidohydrolase YtcJ
MATLFGAWALRAETTTGSLKVGKSADLALIALPDRDGPDPYPLLLESDLPVAGTVFEGDFVAGRWMGQG